MDYDDQVSVKDIVNFHIKINNAAKAKRALARLSSKVKVAAFDIIGISTTNAEFKIEVAKYFVYDKTTDTLTYYFYYNETVAAPDGDVVLPVLFDKVTLPEWVTSDQLATLENFQITVVAEAIQADGFANAGAAWAAFHG